MLGRSLAEYLEEAPLSRFHYVLLLIGCLIYGFTGMNVMLIAATVPALIKEWSLDTATAGLLLSAGYVGMFIGALTCGVLADLFGRKKVLLLTISTMTVFTGLCSIAPDALSMSAIRFLAGIGLGGSLPQPGVYVSEYVPARYRGRFIGLVETAWVYGALLAILFPFVLIPTYGWRLTFLVAFIPLFLVPLVVLFVPESLRYLDLRGRRDEALKLLKSKGLIRIEMNGASGGREIRGALREIWSSTYRNRTVVLWVSWAVLVYTYHGIFLWLPTIYVKQLGLQIVTSLYWVLIITLMQVPGYYSATFLLDRIGRKPVLIAYLGVAGVGSFLLSLAKDATSIFVWSGLISFFNLGAWAGLYTYTPELYPTRIRGTGTGAAASIGRMAGILAPTVTGFLYFSGGLPPTFTVFALAHLIAALSIAFLGIETKSKVLEEISR